MPHYLEQNQPRGRQLHNQMAHKHDHFREAYRKQEETASDIGDENDLDEGTVIAARSAQRGGSFVQKKDYKVYTEEKGFYDERELGFPVTGKPRGKTQYPPMYELNDTPVRREEYLNKSATHGHRYSIPTQHTTFHN